MPFEGGPLNIKGAVTTDYLFRYRQGGTWTLVVVRADKDQPGLTRGDYKAIGRILINCEVMRPKQLQKRHRRGMVPMSATEYLAQYGY